MNGKRFADIHQVIQKYILGNASKQELIFLNDWLNDNPGNPKILFNEKDLYDASKLSLKSLNEKKIQQWIKFQEKISEPEIKMHSFTKFLIVAASIIIALGFGWMSHSLFLSRVFIPMQVELKQVEASKGQIKEVFMADGTHIWLNSDSKLSFPTDFNFKNRRVELSGEAFFEVTANENKPFLVKTNNHLIKVVGTRFNVCEYPGSNIIETTLVEGKVKIITGNIIKDLWPGQQSSFNTKTSIIRIGKVDYEIYSAWKDGRYEFKNESIDKIFRIIERWWDVKIICPDENLKKERISGVLKRYKPEAQIFELINQIIPIEYKIKSNIIYVNSKK